MLSREEISTTVPLFSLQIPDLVPRMEQLVEGLIEDGMGNGLLAVELYFLSLSLICRAWLKLVIHLSLPATCAAICWALPRIFFSDGAFCLHCVL